MPFLFPGLVQWENSFFHQFNKSQIQKCRAAFFLSVTLEWNTWCAVKSLYHWWSQGFRFPSRGSHSQINSGRSMVYFCTCWTFCFFCLFLPYCSFADKNRKGGGMKNKKTPGTERISLVTGSGKSKQWFSSNNNLDLENLNNDLAAMNRSLILKYDFL